MWPGEGRMSSSSSEELQENCLVTFRYACVMGEQGRLAATAPGVSLGSLLTPTSPPHSLSHWEAPVDRGPEGKGGVLPWA